MHAGMYLSLCNVGWIGVEKKGGFVVVLLVLVFLKQIGGCFVKTW